MPLLPQRKTTLMTIAAIRNFSRIGIQVTLIACVLSACKVQEDKHAKGSDRESAIQTHYISSCSDSGDIIIKDSLSGKIALKLLENNCNPPNGENFGTAHIFPINRDTLILTWTSPVSSGNNPCQSSTLEFGWLSTKQVGTAISACDEEGDTVSYSYSQDSTELIVEYSKYVSYRISKSGVIKDDRTPAVTVVSEKKKMISGSVEWGGWTSFRPKIGNIYFESTQVDLEKYSTTYQVVEVTYLSQKLSDGGYRFIAISAHPK
jgi:hypothetical protein